MFLAKNKQTSKKKHLKDKVELSVVNEHCTFLLCKAIKHCCSEVFWGNYGFHIYLSLEQTWVMACVKYANVELKAVPSTWGCTFPVCVCWGGGVFWLCWYTYQGKSLNTAHSHMAPVGKCLPFTCRKIISCQWFPWVPCWHFRPPSNLLGGGHGCKLSLSNWRKAITLPSRWAGIGALVTSITQVPTRSGDLVWCQLLEEIFQIHFGSFSQWQQHKHVHRLNTSDWLNGWIKCFSKGHNPATVQLLCVVWGRWMRGTLNNETVGNTLRDAGCSQYMNRCDITSFPRNRTADPDTSVIYFWKRFYSRIFSNAGVRSIKTPRWRRDLNKEQLSHKIAIELNYCTRFSLLQRWHRRQVASWINHHAPRIHHALQPVRGNEFNWEIEPRTELSYIYDPAESCYRVWQWHVCGRQQGISLLVFLII